MSPSKKTGKGSQEREMVEVTGPAALAVREFTFAHKGGHDKKDLELLQIYLKDLYGTRISIEGLHALVLQARDEEKNKAVADEMESILFSPDRPIPKFKLGSPFCQKCARFKNYKKECPFCGHHEMTVEVPK